MNIQTASTLTETLERRLANRSTVAAFDHLKEVQNLLASIGAPTSGSWEISFYGADPIVPSTVRFGAMAAIALAAKAAMIAMIWKERGGEGQDIHVDVRKALRRFSPFIDRRWETVNGYDGGIYSDPTNPVTFNLFNTKDGMWVMPVNPYPGLHLNTLKLLNVLDTKEAVAASIKTWNGEDLEEAGAQAGVAMSLARPLQAIMKMPVYQDCLQSMPLISIEKIAESDPVPFARGAETPLSGIRALGLSHVIAGPAIGRALALHGADVLNIWNPQDWEHDIFYYTAHVGMRSSTLRLDDAAAHDRFMSLMAGADVFFSNRRHKYLQKRGLDAEALANRFPGLVHTNVLYCSDHGPWAKRVGFDISSGVALGVFCLEGSDDVPAHPPIQVINDYVTGWLATIGTLQALRRRAVEGGSYKVVVSVSRVTLWLMSLGIFDKAFCKETAGSSPEHTYSDPDQFTAETPLGTYTGLTEQVEMSRTPGHYRYVLEPRGAAKPHWL